MIDVNETEHVSLTTSFSDHLDSDLECDRVSRKSVYATVGPIGGEFYEIWPRQSNLKDPR